MIVKDKHITMKTTKIFTILTLLMGLVFSSCTTLKVTKDPNQPDSSVLAISARSKGVGMDGFGIIIRVENVETHQQYDSKTLSGFSKDAIIPNLPAGTYNVVRVEVPVGGVEFKNWSPAIKEFFGTIVIEPNKKYYLGSYRGEFSGSLSDRAFNLVLESHEISNDLVSVVSKAGWKDGDFVLLNPVGIQIRIN